MNRNEANNLIGQQVEAWTAANGIYVGEFVEMLTPRGRPWRAKVRITGVLSVADCEYARAGRQRMGFRIGDTIEVGNSSIRPTTETGVTYLEALQNRLAHVEADIARFTAAEANAPAEGPNAAWYIAKTREVLRFSEWLAKELRGCIAREQA